MPALHSSTGLTSKNKMKWNSRLLLYLVILNSNLVPSTKSFYQSISMGVHYLNAKSHPWPSSWWQIFSPSFLKLAADSPEPLGTILGSFLTIPGLWPYCAHATVSLTCNISYHGKIFYISSARCKVSVANEIMNSHNQPLFPSQLRGVLLATKSRQ